MDSNIQQLFDYQHFAENERLTALIRETERRYSKTDDSRRELTEEESGQIHAAIGLNRSLLMQSLIKNRKEDIT